MHHSVFNLNAVRPFCPRSASSIGLSSGKATNLPQSQGAKDFLTQHITALALCGFCLRLGPTKLGHCSKILNGILFRLDMADIPTTSP